MKKQKKIITDKEKNEIHNCIDKIWNMGSFTQPEKEPSLIILRDIENSASQLLKKTSRVIGKMEIRQKNNS